METQPPGHLRKAIFAALWLLPVSCAFYIVWRHCVAVPFWDEWDTPGAQLASWYRENFHLADLWSQHNESRKVVPRLIYLPLFIAAGWDVRLLIALLMAFVCLGAAGLYQLARRTIRSATAAGLAFALMNLLLFSPRQYENFLSGIQWETFAPGFALVLALIVNLSDRSLRWKTICNGTLALLSTYTFANGMLLWLLAFPLAREASRQSRLFWRSCYILAAVVAIVCYFISYQHPPLSPPLASLPGDAAPLLQFYLIWIGSLFRVAHPSTAGAIVLVLFFGLAAISIWLAAKNREWRSPYPWLVLGAYTIFSGLVTAGARLGFGFTMAADARYAVFTVMLYIATVGLAFTLYERLGGRGDAKRVAQLLGGTAVVVVLAFWGSTFTAERRYLKKFTEYRTHLQLVMRWGDAIPENPELRWLSPYPETPAIIHILGEHNALRPRLVGKDLAHSVTAVPTAQNPSAGVLEQAWPDGMGRLMVNGSARIPERDQPADCVVVGLLQNGRWQPRWVLGTHDANGKFFRPLFAPNLSAEPATVRAWAIDLQNERAFPLAGEIRIGAP